MNLKKRITKAKLLYASFALVFIFLMAKLGGIEITIDTINLYL